MFHFEKIYGLNQIKELCSQISVISEDWFVSNLGEGDKKEVEKQPYNLIIWKAASYTQMLNEIICS